MISYGPLHEALVPEARDVAFTSFGHDVPGILRETLRSGDVFVDIGAKNGVATTLVGARAVGTTGRVIALEPDPVRFVRLLHNVSLNEAANTLCFPVAASDETIHATLFCEVPQGPETSTGRSIRVQRTDTLCARLGCKSVRLVKIDAPGSEHLVLRGMINLLSAKAAPQVLCQVSKWSPQFANDGRESLINFMADFGYVPTQLGSTQILRSPGREAQVRFTLLFAKPDGASTSSARR